MKEIPAEGFKELSAQERTVLYLGDALHQLLDYLQSAYIFTKVDVAFASKNALVIYSYNNGYEVNQYLVDSSGVQHFIYSPGVNNSNMDGLFIEATKEDINKIFRKWEADEKDEYPRTMLSKVEYVGQFDENTKIYCVIIGFKNGVQNKEVIQYFFSELTNSLGVSISRENMEKLSEINPQINASKIAREAAVKILADRFYDNARDLRGEELYETLCLLSCAPYEKNQNRGRIGIFNPSIGKNKAFVKFENPINICKINSRVIRKLLELSDRRNTILVAENGEIIGVYSTNGKYAGTGVLFRGYGKWDLFSDKVGSIIVFDSVMVKLANQALEQRVKDGFSIARIKKYDVAKILRIIKYAGKQLHGTTIIVTADAMQESIRLSKVNRAIRINPILVDEKTILSLSAIDGAMIIDTNGICYAIGAILDGVAEKSGNIARGARYNSAITYVDYESVKNNRSVAIIVSSDDTIDIYPKDRFLREPIEVIDKEKDII